ncbi:hypothetical protein B296_00045781 [Ensete ventricosum]|uniref:Uncharacterized protein n=1 Tax=Ensete ventricosum TaxID=4639 RepID=A0A426Z662_ENSVE|nr:hypothetical protein B296_00045781 [Ensete ventricosum]
MSRERPTPINPGEDVLPVTQPTSGGALQPPLSLSSLGDGNLPSHTPGRYWSLLNDLGLTPPPPNPRTPVVTTEAFQGLTNQVQAIAEILQAIIPYIPQLTEQLSSQPQAASLP